MKIFENLPKYFVIGFFGIGLAALITKAFLPEKEVKGLAVAIPQFSSEAQAGELLFGENCAACHGQNAAGTSNGPPLIHDIYNPGHHPDESFYSAVQKGVRGHHWPYGNMPPQSQVTQEQTGQIIRYIRELQVSNGITYKPHNM
ncbi:c-type cytochrome [Labrenzia sp. R4_2]|uniref:c-type cytochrome n=1 Tax=Labrenzia sp. R4_2 TaxID=2821107 RepID=UPI001AD9BCEE|nr:c-type cytochrome [Labrenzia sp. R4_2]MBO9423015.1 c-type cytochrome [Labrenzia sp. R4_2]